MVVGTAGCGKTTIFNILTEALSNVPESNKYIITKMNPKSITGQEMFGVMNSVGEWEPGIFSEIWKAKNAKANKDKCNWICCDGPVDAIWIENLNTVLDDNKILTLANAERIPMLDTTKMTFEVENLRNASPATVSRNGIVFVSDTDLYWEPLFETWIKDRNDRASLTPPCNPEEEKWIKTLLVKYFRHKSFDNQTTTDPAQKAVFYFMRKNFTVPMESPEVVKTTMMINLLTACIREYTAPNSPYDPIDAELFEKLWCFCFAWAVGGLFEANERQKFHKEVLERVNAALPQISAQRANFDKETVFDYFVNPRSRQWENWKPQEWTAPRRMVFSQLLIPTTDSARAEYIVEKIRSLDEMRSDKRKEVGLLNTLLVGGAGTAKTSIVLMNSTRLPDEYAFKRINFSFYTLPHNFQESIEGEVEKKNAKNYRPFQDKKLVVFLDDFSMP
jgi:dynein heavy chain